jgi:hypothetical protein
MKNIFKISLLSALFVLTSCAHYGSCCKSKEGQCEMKKDCKKEHCSMKSETAPAPAPAPAKK